MNDRYESGRVKLDDLKNHFVAHSNKMNEAETRFHYIDEVLNCLGWDKSDITVEQRANNTIADYTLKILRPVVIWEAKKEGIYYQLPAGGTRVFRPLKSICKDNSNIRDVDRMPLPLMHMLMMFFLTSGLQPL